MPQLKSCAVVVGALLLVACAAQVDELGGEPSERRAATYHDDIAPLVARSCLPCHAPSSSHADLADRESFERHAERALELVQAGAMPKGNVDRSGACQDLVGPEPLATDDVERLESYLAHGMPAGEPAAIEGAGGEAPPWEPTTVVSSEPYLPKLDADGGSGDHRCFVIDDPAPAARELRAFRVLSSQPELLHHAMLFALDAAPDAQAARTLDARASGAGWPCFGTPGIAAARLVGVWTPGQDVVRFSEGYATRLGSAGLVVQLHFDGPAPSAPAQTRFAFELGDGSARELRFQAFAADSLVLAPGLEAIETAQRGSLALPAGSEILGVYPHMHALGRRLSLTARLDAQAHDAAQSCLVQVPRWDYTFQELALYRTPLRVGSADPELTITCQHGTLGVTREVVWGERMEDEMCMAFVLTAAPRQGQPL